MMGGHDERIVLNVVTMFSILMVVSCTVYVGHATSGLDTELGLNHACDVCECNVTLMVVSCKMPTTSHPNPFPVNFPKWTENLYISSCNIQEVPYLAMMEMPNLKRLFANNNTIQYKFMLPDNVITVDLGQNQIKDIGEIFSGKSKLQNINIRKNQIEELSPTAFRGSWKLKYINLEYNPIRGINNSTFRNLSSLSYMDISNGWKLEFIEPGAFDDLCHLSNLYLGGSEDTPVPIETIPSGLFKKCGYNLQQLEIINTNWRRIGSHFLDGLEGTELRFRRNHLESIAEDAFINMKSVRLLNLGQNALKKLHPRLFWNISLLAADLSENGLTEVSEELFKYQTHLRSLLLQRNNFTTISAQALADLKSLEELTLFHGQLQTIEDGAFRNTKLNKLYIFGNDIREIRGAMFQTSGGTLANVHIYLNPIENITDEALHYFAENATMFISCGHLYSIPKYSRKDVTLECVPDSFRGAFTVSSYFAEAFRHDGFECQEKIKQRGSIWHCKLCPVGTYGTRKHHGCTSCPAGGFYQNMTGTSPSYTHSFGCKNCTNGTYVPHGRGTSPGDCVVCPSGTNQSLHAGFRACFCANGYYRTNRFGACTLCKDEGIYCNDSDVPTVRKGFSLNFTILPTANETAFRLFSENIKLDNIEAINHQANYDNYDFPKANRCPRSESCRTKNGFETECEKGYEDWLCTACTVGHYPVFDQCIKCPENAMLIFLLQCGGLLAVVLGIVIFAYIKSKLSPSRENRLVDGIIAQTKIFLGFYQVMGGLFSALDDVHWPFETVFSQILHVVELNILQVIARPQYCAMKLRIDPYMKFTFGFVAVALVFVCFATMYSALILYYHWKCKTFKLGQISHKFRKRVEFIKEWCSLITFVILFTMYPSLCSITFQISQFSCVSFDLVSDGGAKARFVRADMRFRCEDHLNPNRHIFNKLFYVGLAFIALFPLVTLLLLKRNMNRNSISAQSDDISTETTPLLHSIRDNSETLSVEYPKWCQFLTKSYKAKFWYWEMLELFRKMIQIFFLTTFGAENGLSFAVTIFISISFAMAHASSKPMAERLKVEHWLQVFSLVAISFNLVIFFALSYEGTESEGDESKFTGIVLTLTLYILNGFLISVIFVKFLKSMFGILRKTFSFGLKSFICLLRDVQRVYRCRCSKPCTKSPQED